MTVSVRRHAKPGPDSCVKTRLKYICAGQIKVTLITQQRSGNDAAGRVDIDFGRFEPTLKSNYFLILVRAAGGTSTSFTDNSMVRTERLELPDTTFWLNHL